ncbi:multisubstrate pseudouridine synthase 7 [Conoideocrella luteorostrata]|uniref:Multisubstrate pseudouridine synthase 7 n=1 Tax=Conoideocrella luteorostrata TaxID=1105319 RepID=A0AAJ0FSZ3_9HYPO|nr:multisubstrate pseudouridine synthase 7 [Conoideocrella luteorostrata]
MAEKEHYNVRVGSSHAKSLGITHRTTPLASSWTGDMRVRFSDFQVNEIGKDGLPIHLRTIGIENDNKQSSQNKDSGVPKPKQHEPSREVQNGKSESEPSVIEIPPQDITALENLSSQNFAQDLVLLFNSGNGPTGEQPKTAVSDVLDDKAKRAQLHGEVRRIFKSRLETTTGHDGAIVASYVAPRKNNKKNRGRRGQPDDEPVGQYLHFTLYKDNRDTMDAVSQIARLLRVKPQIIGYAGTKDRRASTTQRCSVRYQRKRAMAGLNGKLWGITTGDYEYRDDPIHLGQLLGNEFVITLKNCKMVNEDALLPPKERLSLMKKNVESALTHMASHGWINYFGHQRFGTHDVGTHQIGRLILGDNFEGAVNSLLQYDPDMAAKAEAGEIPDESSRRDEYLRHQACMLFQTGKDFDRAAKIIPRRYAGESCVLRHLTRSGKSSSRDFAGAITHITRGLRSMYLHAYQSHVWNHAASHRFTLHGTTVIKGDLVIITDEESQPVATETGRDQDGDEIINPLELEEDEDAPLRARPLSQEEAASGKYTIHDIVLPSPGYDVIYPDNEVGEFYKEFMGREEHGSLDPLKMRRLRREFSLPGRYRKLMQRFLDEPSVQVKLYDDDTEQMHPTDMDVLKNQRNNSVSDGKRKRDENDGDDEVDAKKAKVEEEADAKTDDADRTSAGLASTKQEHSNGTAKELEKGDLPAEPTKIAVAVKFQLASSAYATVTLRELMGDGAEDDERTTS